MLAKRIILMLVFLWVFDADTLTAQVLINEGSNRNYSVMPDEDGDYPDWIELYNAGTEAVNLLNYSLTDNTTNPAKWVFPEIVMQAGEYRTIYCSGKNRRPFPGFTHVVNDTAFTAVTGWNTHWFNNAYYWDGVSGILINTCSYNSAGYTSNSVFNQTVTPYLSSVYAFVDGSPDACMWAYGTPVYLRPNIQMNGITIGTGEVQNANTSYPAPYGNWYWCARNQMLIQASELLDAGFTEGFITSIAFDVASTDPNTVYDYIEISLKSVDDISVSSMFKPAEPGVSLHTNFKIADDGETISLYSSNQVLLSSLFVNCEDLDNSSGSSPDASSDIYLFQTGTPAATNNMSPTFTGYLIPPILSTAPGFFENPFSVSISNPNGAASTLHYTTDGSDPTTSSPQYNGNPVYISGSVVLKARAFKTGKLPSQNDVATYLIGVDHSTPVLSVVTGNDNLYGEAGIFDNWWQDWERAAYVQYFDSTKQLIFSQRAGIQMDGGWGGSRYQPQHSFRVELADGVLGEDPLNYQLIPNRPGRTTYSKFYLRNGSNQYLVLPYKDACQVAAMSNGTNNYHAAWRPLSVYLNGEYFGLYELREKIDSEYFEFLDGADPDSTTILSQSAWYGGSLRAVEGSVDPFFVSSQAIHDLNPSDTDFWEKADVHFDLNWYTDYIIGESWMGNTDWPWNNIKIYRSDVTGQRWRFCLIDQELAMLPNGWTDYNFDHIAYMLGQDPSIPYISVWLKGIQNNRFRDYFINRFADQMNTIYRYERLSAIENNMYSLTFPEMPNEFARWGDPNNIPMQMFAFGSNHITLREQYLQRTPQVRNHILSNFNLPGLVDLSLDVFPAEAGSIRISTIKPESYPWQGIYFNGVPVSITAEPVQGYTFSHWAANGLITDTLNPVFRDTLNVANISFVAFFEDETTAVQAVTAKQTRFSLFPIPAIDVLYIAGDSKSDSHYQIIDLNGRIMKSGFINSTETTVDISALSAGVYLMRITNQHQQQEQLRFVKVKKQF
ncbi:MAG: T9SS type A sorting domain-containing protein [Bacteroidales bacterium]|nr:T9SS type A sorting domain-containing protein [Bacteroidales bacterium]